MQVLLTMFGHQPELEPWETVPFSRGVERGPGPGDRRDVYQRAVACEPPGEPEERGPFRRLEREVLGYRIFPPQLVSGVLRREPVEPGDPVGICYHLVPGVDLFFAARVYERFDGPIESVWRAGFSYRTLQGHPETGEETFSVEKDLSTGRISIALRSWSRPGTLLARALGPWTRFCQVHAGHAALRHLAAVAARDAKLTP